MQKFTPKQYLQMDIASNFGLDKADWDERLKWFATNEHQLFSLVTQAKTPALYYAALLAWREVEQGKPTGYPISLDATASGLQILACLTGDRRAAQLCNVVNMGHCTDAYQVLYSYMQAKAGAVGIIDRDMVKEAVMTALYNSEAIPKKVFGTGKMLGIFYETVEENAPAAWELNQMYKAMWDSSRDTYLWTLPDNFHVVVKVIDTKFDTVRFGGGHFDVSTKVHAPTAEGRSLSANTTHSLDGMIVREMTRRCNYNPKQVAQVRFLMENPDVWNGPGCKPTDDKHKLIVQLLEHYKASGYLSARILDCIGYHTAHLVPVKDVLELLDSLPAKPFEVISIHDCFRCLANYGNDLREQYNRQLYLIARSNMLSFILSQLVGGNVAIHKQDPTLANDILHSNYSLS
jgi:hypothetical protein